MNENQDEIKRINRLLAEKLLAKTVGPGSHPTAIFGFNLVKRESTNELRVFYKPFIGLTVKGFKRTIIGKEEYNYGEFHCLVTGVDMPSESYITTASPDEPFLALSLELDRGLVASLAAEIKKNKKSVCCMDRHWSCRGIYCRSIVVWRYLIVGQSIGRFTYYCWGNCIKNHVCIKYQMVSNL